MTQSSAEWLREFDVTPRPPGAPSDPEITRLANGHLLISYEDAGNGVDDQPGSDIIGVIYDALGEVVVPAFRLNRSGSSDNETDHVITATPDGFFLAYEDSNVENFSRIRFDRYDLDGDLLVSSFVPLEPRSDPEFGQGDGIARIELGSAVGRDDGSVLLTYTRVSIEEEFSLFGADDETAQDIVIDLISPAGTLIRREETRLGIVVETPFLPVFDPLIFKSNPGFPENPKTVILADGSLVTAFNESVTLDNQDIAFTIDRLGPFNIFDDQDVFIRQEFSFVTDSQAIESRPEIAALAGGGFVIGWVEQNPQGDFSFSIFQIFDADGDPVGAPNRLDAPFGADFRPPRIEPLPDGGFVILGTPGIELNYRSFDADGTPREPDDVRLIGRDVTARGSAGDPALAVTEDGRIVTAYLDDGALFASVFDSREDTIEGTSGDDLLTAPTFRAVPVNGLDGDDTIFGGTQDDVINGGPGNDVIDAGLGNDFVIGEVFTAGVDQDIIFGGAGNDNLLGAADANLIFGDAPFLPFDFVWNPDNGHYYAFVTDGSLTWDEAEAAADDIGFGIHLATLTSPEENAFVSAFAPDILLWIGLFEERSTFFEPDDFRWSSGEPFSVFGGEYRNWSPLEPNDTTNTSRALLSTLSNDDGRVWVDVSEFASASGYVLEWAGANDSIAGGDGGDFISGGIGDDVIDGREGDDRIDGGSGLDELILADVDGQPFSPDDLIFSELVVEAQGPGTDSERVDAARISGVVSGPAGTDTFFNVEILRVLDTGSDSYIVLQGMSLDAVLGRDAVETVAEAGDTVFVETPDGTFIETLVAGPGDLVPLAADDSASVEAGGTVIIDVLGNDIDLDGDPLQISPITSRPLGSVTITPDGRLRFETGDAFDDLAPGETVTETFAYTVNDGRGSTASAEVAVTVTGLEPIDLPSFAPLVGTGGSDRVDGTEAPEAITPGGGALDRLSGGFGPDAFIFGDALDDGVIGRVVISDFSQDVDVIAVPSFDRIASSQRIGDTVAVTFTGDGDVAYLRGFVDPDTLPVVLISDLTLL